MSVSSLVAAPEPRLARLPDHPPQRMLAGAGERFRFSVPLGSRKTLMCACLGEDAVEVHPRERGRGTSREGFEAQGG